MIFHYKGNFSGDPEELPYLDHEPGAVKFEEAETIEELSGKANAIALVIMVSTMGAFFMTAGINSWSILGALAFVISLVPHELLHAICFKDDVYMYSALKKGLLFVTGPERMSKARFIFMSLLPNIVFGFIPYAIFLIDPTQGFLGTLGALAIPAGAGDYMNVFHAVTQVPNGARVYMHKFNTYWYIP